MNKPLIAPHRRLALRLHRNEAGATIVENVIILPLFLVLLVVGIDMMLLSVNVLSTRYVCARTFREASLGDLNEVQIRQLIQNFGGSLGLSLRDEHISMCPLRNYPCTQGTIDRGNAQDLIVLELRVPLRGIILSSMANTQVAVRLFDFRARLLGRREP